MQLMASNLKKKNVVLLIQQTWTLEETSKYFSYDFDGPIDKNTYKFALIFSIHSKITIKFKNKLFLLGIR